MMLSKGDRMDAIEAAFNGMTHWPAEFRRSSLWYAARQFAGYQGESYIQAVSTLANKYETAEEIAALPTRVAAARS